MKPIMLMLMALAMLMTAWYWQPEVLAPVLPARVDAPAEAVAQTPAAPLLAATPTPSDQVQKFTAQLLSPPYSQAVTAENLAQTEPPAVAAITVPLDDGIVWQLQLSQYRFSYPEPITATVRVQGEQLAVIRYQLRSLDQQLVSSGVLVAETDGLFRLELEGQTDFPAELELSVESEPGHGALAKLSYNQPVAWLEQPLALEADDSDLVLPLQLQVQQAGLYRVQAVLGQQQTPAEPLAILQGEFVLESGSQHIRLRAHHSVLPDKRFVAELSRLQLELAPPMPGAATGYGRPLTAPVALGDFDPQSLNRTPYQPDAQAVQSAVLLQQLSR
ncbi:hypothetical protein EOE67_04280 [Rheinheimera riviphila]|uniref:Uncharacterized protein n=1 Tax=Rheinheimera riviphila TaxID=1834037 RepID=A0A437R262_9GAMM|nr:hypothetical protein [Rheinheimera riviphila]RVU40803.1 hypothetical protein EOE67_04280 [Rheinheimera riviphila]